MYNLLCDVRNIPKSDLNQLYIYHDHDNNCQGTHDTKQVSRVQVPAEIWSDLFVIAFIRRHITHSFRGWIHEARSETSVTTRRLSRPRIEKRIWNNILNFLLIYLLFSFNELLNILSYLSSYLLWNDFFLSTCEGTL